MYDFITIGSATQDVFIQSDVASIVTVSQMAKKSEFMSFPYGAKTEIADFSKNLGGGAVNTATNFANLGLKTSTIIKLGNDELNSIIKLKLAQSGIDIMNIIDSKKDLTGFSIILVSFQGDRTVLAHRGANAHVSEKEVNFNAIKNSRWVYVSPLSGDSNKILDKIAKFCEENKINLAINAGTTALKKGAKYFSKILKTAQIVVMNKEEATLVTKIQVRPDTKEEKYSKEKIHPDIVSMLKELKGDSEAIVVITDGKNGVYCYDGKKIYICPIFPSPVVSTLGAGDAFSSTFCATYDKFNGNIEKALMYASINSASICGHFGAQDGFLTFDEIEAKLKETPEFKAKTICV
ncbi:MAG: carbohydrate kinase family protein [Candidatus Gastranaerophilales bacterium]|nr:carbohydrate kinase family protein [Candidatus Gastranaerophilales bacterium]